MELDWTRRRASQPFLMDWVNQLCAVLSLVCIADSRELYTCAACSFKSSLMYIPVWCHSLCAQNQLLMTAYRKELGLCQPGRTRKEKDKKNIPKLVKHALGMTRIHLHAKAAWRFIKKGRALGLFPVVRRWMALKTDFPSKHSRIN